MTTVPGLFTAGDGVGCSGHKFSSGSHYEGRVAAKGMVQYITDNPFTPELAETKEELVDLVWKPVRMYLDNCEYTTAQNVNPNYCKPDGMALRLMKATNEYGGGTATYYQTSSKSLEILIDDLLFMMHEDCEKLAAGDLHELMRCWEIYHRLYTVEAHVRHIQFRKETRYPGFYYQADFPGQDDEEWFCFVNSSFDRKANEWTVKKEPYHRIIPMV